MIGLSALLCAVYVTRYSSLSAADKAKFNPTTFSLSGIGLAQLAVAVLAVLAITSEYGTGTIRSTFAAIPHRQTVLAAKGVVLAAVTAVVGITSSLAAFLVGQAILSTQHIQAHLSDPAVLRAVIGAGLYQAVLAGLSLAIGALIRHSAGAIATIFGVMFVLPAIASALPSGWGISKYLPTNAGQAILKTGHDTSSLSPWVGFAAFCLYAAVALIAARIALQRRDT
jgi:ABC-type transport system involved in multi-copper enzyme maturation permease subunit